MVVRMRATRSHRNNRRSHHALVGVKISSCVSCQADILSHRACANCGQYNGRKAHSKKDARLARATRKAKALNKSATEPKKEDSAQKVA